MRISSGGGDSFSTDGLFTNNDEFGTNERMDFIPTKGCDFITRCVLTLVLGEGVVASRLARRGEQGRNSPDVNEGPEQTEDGDHAEDNGEDLVLLRSGRHTGHGVQEQRCDHVPWSDHHCFH